MQLAVTEYARDYIASLMRRGWTLQRIGDRLGCSHVWVLHLSQPDKYGTRLVGADLEHRLAHLLHGGSIDALRRAALHLASGAMISNEDETGLTEFEPSPTPDPAVTSPKPGGSRRRRTKTK